MASRSGSTLLVLFSVFLSILLPRSALAEDVVKGLETPQDEPWRHYYSELLHLVMEKTVPDFGPYSEQPCNVPMSPARRIKETVHGALINVVVLGVVNRQYDEDLINIPYPVDKGLLGYRIALINALNQPKIDRVESLVEMRSLTVGQAQDWSDVRIYRANNIPVELAASYDLLMPMLMHGRFDLFLRGLNEVQAEYDLNRDHYPGLAIDLHLLIKFRAATYFYVSRSEPRLAARIKAGLERMMQDGSFDAWFNGGFGKLVAPIPLDHRLVIELDNAETLPGLAFDPHNPWWSLHSLIKSGDSAPAAHQSVM